MQKLSILFTFMVFFVTATSAFSQPNKNASLTKDKITPAHKTASGPSATAPTFFQTVNVEVNKKNSIPIQEKTEKNQWINYSIKVNDSGRKKIAITITNEKVLSDLGFTTSR